MTKQEVFKVEGQPDLKVGDIFTMSLPDDHPYHGFKWIVKEIEVGRVKCKSVTEK
ncbi:hypothetical protein [Rhizorhabdus histidinilytica]|uniref:hypothetical protein n=1 Tax=Rhizorhabdus histidinilytica TaxID=439228 RepID=UPI0032202B6D